MNADAPARQRVRVAAAPGSPAASHELLDLTLRPTDRASDRSVAEGTVSHGKQP